VHCRKWLRFAKCSECVSLRRQRWDRSLSDEDRQRAADELHEHYGIMKKERVYLRKKMNKAIKHPDRCMQISFDGTSQLAFGYPSFSELSHNEDEAKYRIQSHLQIVMVAGSDILVFENKDYIFKGPDVTVEILQRTLKRHEQIYGSLPDVLYLQADNCWRENKNHCVLAYLGSLVERGVFKKIELSFFYVGHTHFGPDQVASRISCACKHTDIYTRAQNLSVVEKSYTPNLKTYHLDVVADAQHAFMPGFVGVGKNRKRAHSKVFIFFVFFCFILNFLTSPGIRIQDQAPASHERGPAFQVAYGT
jgi:hypothetical protein